MNHFTVNGVEKECPVAEERPFHDLIDYVYKSLNSPSSLISSVRVNGLELSSADEQALSEIPLSAFTSVEVFTSHPKEVAQETLQSLIPFLERLEGFSRRLSETIGLPEFRANLGKLVEGIQTFTEAVTDVRQILRVGILPAVQVLEADLLSVLKDMLRSQEETKELGDTHSRYMAELLAQHLPTNLEQWRKEGIPALIRSRDS